MTSVWGTLIGVAFDGGFSGVGEGWEDEELFWVEEDKEEEEGALGRLPFWKIEVDSNEAGNSALWSMVVF